MTVQIYGNAENDWTVKQFSNDAKLKLMDYGSATYVTWGVIDNSYYTYWIYKEGNESFSDIPSILDGRYCGDISFTIKNGAEIYTGKITILPAKPSKDFKGLPDGTNDFASLPSWLKQEYNCKANLIVKNTSSFSPSGNASDIDLSELDTTGRTNLSNLFGRLTRIKSLDLSNINTSSATTLSCMFSACQNIESLNLSNFDTRNVTDISGLFEYCKGLTSVDVSSFDTSNVTNMAGVFSNCGKLTSIDLSTWDTSKVTNMSYMFSRGFRLKEINLSSFNTSAVTDFSDMFSYCRFSLTTLNLSNFNTANATNMYDMFAYCSALTTLNLSNFRTPKVTNMMCMFDACKNLTSLNISNLGATNVENLSYMFRDCSALTTLDLSSIDATNVTDMTDMFKGCSSLTNITFGTNWASNSAITELDYRVVILTHDSCIDLFNKLATRTDSPLLRIHYSTYEDVSAEEKYIATNKGWNIKTTDSDGSEIAFVPSNSTT